jgi:crossover junction endodeoxyribonuclease RusA
VTTAADLHPLLLPQEGVWVMQLPFDRPLSMNDRMHHMVKAKTVKAWRDAAKDAIADADVPSCVRVRATLVYVPGQNRRRDPDNLVAAMKPVVDALVDAGVVPDDTQEEVERVWPQILPAERVHEGGRFYLRVESL